MEMKFPKLDGFPCSLGLEEADSYMKCFSKDQTPRGAEKSIREQKPEPSQIIPFVLKNSSLAA